MRLRASRGGQGGSTKEAMDIRSLERQSKAIRDWRAYVNDLFKLWGPGYIDGSI